MGVVARLQFILVCVLLGAIGSPWPMLGEFRLADQSDRDPFPRILTSELRQTPRRDSLDSFSADPSAPPNRIEVPSMVDAVIDPRPVVVENPKPTRSNKTTITGIALAVGLVADEIAAKGIPEDIVGWIVLLFKAVAPTLLGIFARDKNVSSEGQKVDVVKG